METVSIGTDLLASRIGLGTWAMGGWMWGGTDRRAAVRAIHAALDHGITLIDTAPVYGFGYAEAIVGAALAVGGRRERALVATKAELDWTGGRVFRNTAPARIRREVADSLRRLKTDYIDLCQLHWPDPSVPIEETAAAFADLVKEGKIRAVGVSNFSPTQMEAFRRIQPIATVQPPYNLFERAIERDVLPYAQESGLVVLAYGALCRGLLTGKITARSAFDGDDLRRTDPKFQQPRLGQYLAAVRALGRFARERFGKTVLALAVRWILDQGGTIALWGARRPDHLAAVGDVLGWTLDDDARREIDRILARTIHDPVGPEFMAPPDRSALSQVA